MVREGPNWAQSVKKPFLNVTCHKTTGFDKGRNAWVFIGRTIEWYAFKTALFGFVRQFMESFKIGSSPGSWKITPDVNEVKHLLIDTVNHLESDLESRLFINYEPFELPIGFQVKNHVQALQAANYHEAEHSGKIFTKWFEKRPVRPTLKKPFFDKKSGFFRFYIVCAQTKKIDKIIKKDHSVIEATVSKISDKSIEYVFSGETLVNSLDVSQIVRIEFANGRKQNFNSAPVEAPSPKPIPESVSKNASPEVQILKPNTIAVLPAPFVNSENLSSSEEMAKFAQSDIYNKLVAKLTNIFPLVVQDVRTTNSLLRKAGIDYKNIDETPIEDLQRILGVDNILAAKVSYSLKT
eukprot:gene9487-11102_t